MNVISLLTPKASVAWLYEDFTLRQGLEKLRHHGYTAIPVLARDGRYVGTVSMVDTTGVFVALDGGIDCLCSYPKRGRPPRGARVTVRILGINHESNRIWGAITHIAMPY